MLFISKLSYTLSIDTSTPRHAVALLKDESVLTELAFLRGTYKGSLLRVVDFALTECGLKISDLNSIVLGVGPGAFTGLRVSMALVKSLALSLGLPVYPVSSLMGLALRVPVRRPKLVSCVIDARKNEVYASVYRQTVAGLEEVIPEALYTPENWSATVNNFNEEVYVAGAALDVYRERIKLENAVEIKSVKYPSASAMGQYAIDLFENTAPTVTIDALEPKYIREDNFALPKPFSFD